MYTGHFGDWYNIVKSGGKVKPIGMIFCDGGPDENPRFPKTLDVAIQHSKHYNLDALLISSHAPGMSAYNQVEKRMAPLSKALSGVLLPHEIFGTHLDSSRRTVDSELERRNFMAAGKILAEIWENVVLDNFPIVAEYQENATNDHFDIDEKWVSVHCRISQYLLQIVRCTEHECCGDFRSTWGTVFPARFLPPPIPVRQIAGGPTVPSTTDVKASDQFANLWKAISINGLIPKSKFKEMPYDSYCPSVKGLVQKRVCKACHIYYPSIAACDRHRDKGCLALQEAPEAEDQEENVVTVSEGEGEEVAEKNEDDVAPVLNIFELLQNNEFIYDE